MLILNLDHFQADAQVTNVHNVEGGGYVKAINPPRVGMPRRNIYYPEQFRNSSTTLMLNAIAEGPNISDVYTEFTSINNKTESRVLSAISLFVISFAA